MSALQGESYPVKFPPDLTNPHANEGFLFETTPNVQVLDGETRISGAKVEYKVFEPETLVDDVPVHIRNGFFADGPAYYGLARALAASGRRTVVVESVRDQIGVGALCNDVLRLQSQAGYAAVRDVNYHFGPRKADFIAHSLGGATTTRLALQHPRLVRSISYTGPVGQDGRHTFKNRLCSTGAVIGNELLPNLEALRQAYDPERSMAFDSLRYGSRLVRTAREAWSAARIDDRLAVAHLSKEYGIRVGAVLMSKDLYFDAEDILLNMGRIYGNNVRLISGGHIDPNINPVPHAAVQLDLLNALNHSPDLKLAPES